jgi:hypothetical protein
MMPRASVRSSKYANMLLTLETHKLTPPTITTTARKKISIMNMVKKGTELKTVRPGRIWVNTDVPIGRV